MMMDRDCDELQALCELAAEFERQSHREEAFPRVTCPSILSSLA